MIMQDKMVGDGCIEREKNVCSNYCTLLQTMSTCFERFHKKRELDEKIGMIDFV